MKSVLHQAVGLQISRDLEDTGNFSRANPIAIHDRQVDMQVNIEYLKDYEKVIALWQNCEGIGVISKQIQQPDSSGPNTTCSGKE